MLALPERGNRRRLVGAGVLLAGTLPWVVGLDMPSLRLIRPAILHPTEVPTADGHIPLGAYAGFVRHVATLDRFQIDHGQQIWLAAMAVHYHLCDRFVPVLETPMASYIALAAMLHGQQPQLAEAPSKLHCGFGYADLRSLTRETFGGVADLRQQDYIHLVSDPAAEQAIVRIDQTPPPVPLKELAREMLHRFGGKDIQFRFTGSRQLTRVPWARYVFFSYGGQCEFHGVSPVENSAGDFHLWTLDAQPEAEPKLFALRCAPSPLAGFARDAVPPYMSRN
jgi:hypothetical protein